MVKFYGKQAQYDKEWEQLKKDAALKKRKKDAAEKSKKLKEHVLALLESSSTSWTRPTDKDLELEYKIEYSIKPLKGMTNNAFPTVESFKEAARQGEVVSLTPTMDKKITYRSHTRSKEQLISLIKGYASYPEFRNEKTIENLFDRIGSGKSMTMPIVLRFPNGQLRIMGGNTRLDVAFILKKIPQVLIIDVPKK